MSEKPSTKVVVRRPPGSTADDAESAADAELELVSTQMVKQILSSRDLEDYKGIKEAARRGSNGVLARDPVTGFFQVIEDEELQAIVESGQELPKLSRPSDVTLSPLHDYADSQHFSLVSMQALRRVFDDAASEFDGAATESDAADTVGEDFDPYRG